MVRTVVARAGLLLSLVLALSVLSPTLAIAQVSPLEGAEWHLVSYAAGDGAKSVPWDAQATLQLAGGQLIGHGGCNRIGGSYQLDGTALRFDRIFVNQRACPSTAESAVEGGFVDALPRVVSWGIDGSAVAGASSLHLYDAEGEILLTFQRPALSLTLHDIDQLASILADQQAAIERLDERLDNVRIGTLRERISVLEAAVAEAGDPDLSSFDAAEKVLLGAVRQDIAETCEPRRTDNPAGTIAALQCKPDAPEVSDMAFYLMEGDDAARVYQQRMKRYEVKTGTQNRACAFGRPSQMAWVGGGFEVAGCYRNEDGRANLRFVNTLADCRQLTAGATQVKNPSIYIAVLGPDRDIASLYQWAASSTDWEAGDDLFDPIKQAGQPWSNQCPHG